MSSDLVERRRYGKILIKKNTLSFQVKRSIYWLFSALLGIIIILSIVFLLNTSQTYQKGNVLQLQQQKKEELLIQNRALINKIIDAMASQKIENSDILKSMLTPENPQYIKDSKASRQ